MSEIKFTFDSIFFVIVFRKSFFELFVVVIVIVFVIVIIFVLENFEENSLKSRVTFSSSKISMGEEV